MTAEEIIPLLKRYVIRNSDAVDIQWDQKIKPKLFINPYSRDYYERRRVAHYALLAASLQEYEVVGRSENARKLLVHLHRAFGDGLFKATKAERIKSEIRKCKFYYELGPLKGVVPGVLASVNEFVRDEAEGDLVTYSLRFKEPKDMVEAIGKHVERMGGPFKEKSWIYMRWMVRRPKAGLGVFNNFSPRDLYLPLTINILNVAMSLGLIEKVGPSWWEDEERVNSTREKVTEFAKKLFPNDPAKVDYPFFLLGRWLKGKHPSVQVLRDALQFFDSLYRLTGRAQVEYDIVSRYSESVWERIIKDDLNKMNIRFRHGTVRFPLPGNIFYTPDFILTESKVDGKKIVLEPHGKMTKDDVNKYSLFRKIYGNDYFLTLIMRNDDISYYRALGLLPEEAYDEVWPIEDVHLFYKKFRSFNTYRVR